MALTGGLFLALMATVTVAVFVALVARWSSLAGPGWQLARRAALLLALNGLVLTTAATALNDQFVFFGDWTDLRGALDARPIQVSGSHGPPAATGRPAAAVLHGDAGLRAAGATTRAGVTTYTVHGPASGLTGTVLVQLPPGYDNPTDAAVRYPVLETFQGYPADPRQWVDTMNLGGAVEKEVAARHLRPVVIVSPQVEIPPGVDTECVNGRPGAPELETWLTQDVPSWVSHTLRVDPARTSWATIGLSAGGWCAAMTAMLHPARYGAAIVMGGYFRPEFGSRYVPYAARSPLATRYDLVALARHGPPVLVWLETSHADKVSYLSSAAFLAAARPPLATDAIVLAHAGHRTGVWQDLLPGSLAWLGGHAAGFAPLT